MSKYIDGEKSSLFLKTKRSLSLSNWENNDQILGRSGDAWVRLLTFYLIFYSCLIGFFALLFAVFYQTIDTQYHPKYTNESSVLTFPSLGFRPRSNESVLSTLIWFRNNLNETKTMDYVNQLNTFIASYEGTDDDGQNIRDCDFKQYREDKRRGFVPEQACRFRDTWLKANQEEFASISFCHKAEFWGFRRHSPCILLKLNKMIGWEPDVYTRDDLDNLPSDMPKELQDHIQNHPSLNNETGDGILLEMVWLHCRGENPADIEYLRKIDYYPSRGFPAYYFPYLKNDAYRSPVVGVQFNFPEPNVVINVECSIWAKNIQHDRRNKLGVVHFELLKD